MRAGAGGLSPHAGSPHRPAGLPAPPRPRHGGASGPGEGMAVLGLWAGAGRAATRLSRWKVRARRSEDAASPTCYVVLHPHQLGVVSHPAPREVLTSPLLPSGIALTICPTFGGSTATAQIQRTCSWSPRVRAEEETGEGSEQRSACIPSHQRWILKALRPS